MTADLTFKLTFITRSCVLDCVKPLLEIGENHTVEKLNKTKKGPPKPNIFLDSLIKMLFEDKIYTSYNSSNKVRKKKFEKNKYIFEKVPVWHTVAVYLQYFNIYFIQTFKCELFLQEVMYVCLFISPSISDVKSAKQYFYAH